MLDKTFADVLPRLKEIITWVNSRQQVEDFFLDQHFPKQKQWDWGMYILKELNFDFEAGRQDISEHPFSSSFNSNDVRITTRIDENDFSNMTWSCIHELGHALYEQGLPIDQYGLPSGEACSYSIHESQSRLWENNVGRSKSFWDYYFPRLKNYFPEQFNDISPQQFYKGINKVQPSLIRTEADELTYHFHVFIRYELEKKLIEGSLDAREIPEFWRYQYKDLLGVEVLDDKNGCLQDVHWSHGSFGYFPTYSLGSFYAGQFFSAAKREIGNLDDHVASGNFAPLLDWLRNKVHIHGRTFTSEELCRKVTGTILEVDQFTNLLFDKYKLIY
jgi:carboxypeptidase Taq